MASMILMTAINRAALKTGKWAYKRNLTRRLYDASANALGKLAKKVNFPDYAFNKTRKLIESPAPAIEIAPDRSAVRIEAQAATVKTQPVKPEVQGIPKTIKRLLQPLEGLNNVPAQQMHYRQALQLKDLAKRLSEIDHELYISGDRVILKLVQERIQALKVKGIMRHLEEHKPVKDRQTLGCLEDAYGMLFGSIYNIKSKEPEAPLVPSSAAAEAEVTPQSLSRIEELLLNPAAETTQQEAPEAPTETIKPVDPLELDDAAAEAFERAILGAPPKTTDELRSDLKDPLKWSKALSTLEEMGTDAKSAIPDILELLDTQLRDDDSMASFDANRTISVLGHIGPAAILAFPKLSELARNIDLDWFLAHSIYYAMHRIDRQAAAAIFMGIINDPSYPEKIRKEASFLVSANFYYLGGASAGIVDYIKDPSRNFDGRRMLLKQITKSLKLRLKECEPKAFNRLYKEPVENMVVVLWEMLNDPDPDMRTLAKEALQLFEPIMNAA
jgi:hypothetical protein